MRFTKFDVFLLCTSMPSAAGKSVCYNSLLYMNVLCDQLGFESVSRGAFVLAQPAELQACLSVPQCRTTHVINHIIT